MATAVDTSLDWLGRKLGAWLRQQIPGHEPFVSSDPAALRRSLRPADVLLVAGGNRRVDGHQVPDAVDLVPCGALRGQRHRCSSRCAGRAHADRGQSRRGVRGCASLAKYDCYHTRICRPVGLTDADREAVIAYMLSHLGTRYDMRNVVDLARYLLPTPPVPTRWRRRMIALGSGEPTRAICSTLIAAAFQHVRYPILPRVERIAAEERGMTEFQRQAILHIRHHSLYTPADFDLSPYFRVVKPTIEGRNSTTGA